MRAFLQCVREAWKASHKNQDFFYDILVAEDYDNKFHDLAASIIKEEDLETDFQDVLLKTPSEANANDVFVADGRIQ